MSAGQRSVAQSIYDRKIGVGCFVSPVEQDSPVSFAVTPSER